MKLFWKEIWHYLSSNKRLSLSGKTVRSNSAAIVDCADWHMAAITGKFNSVVLDNILLNYGVSACTLQFGLLKRLFVEVTLWNIAIVTRDVCGHLGRAYR